MPPFSLPTKILLALLFFITLEQAAFAGRIIVNTLADNNQQDEFISLREALMMANGTRVAWNSGSDFVPDEARLITDSYGAGIADTVAVVADPGSVIFLSGPLPQLSDMGDGIEAGSLVVVDGIDRTLFGLQLAAGNHSISGLTLKNFNRPLHITSDDNVINGTLLDGGDGFGIELNERQRNRFSNMVITDFDAGIHLYNCADNHFSFVHVYKNRGTGIALFGSGTTGNVFSGCNIGLEEPPSNLLSGNSGFGIHLAEGAHGNRFGSVETDSTFCRVSGNSSGGILVEGSGTTENLLHSILLGWDPAEPNWTGNGGGHGIHLRNGAHGNFIGKQGANSVIVIGGHKGNGVLIEGEGTEENILQRLDIGWADPLVSSFPLPNMGHGVEIRSRANNNIIAGPQELTQVEVNYTGVGKHGFYVNGNDAEHPLSGIQFGVYHIGDKREPDGPPVIGGDAIRIEGNVQGITIGHDFHFNTTNGAAGYGIRIIGPEVSDIELVRIISGHRGGTLRPNDLGGILIENGAHNVRFAGPGPSLRSSIAGNKGPGITIGASNLPPYDITIRNTDVGIASFGEEMPNQEAGILIKGSLLNPESANVTPLRIGIEAEDDGNTIGSNNGPGILMRNVDGVSILGNRIGVNSQATQSHANQGDGIHIQNSRNITIGTTSVPHGGNTIAGNRDNGIRLENADPDFGFIESVTIQGNYIGTTDASLAIANQKSGIVLKGSAVKGVLIGGEQESERNVISGNMEHGVEVRDGAEGWRLLNNLIGCNSSEVLAIANGKSGVFLSNVRAGHVGQKMEPHSGNVISGNTEAGIHIEQESGDNLVIANNRIGSNREGTLALPNQDGIFLKGPIGTEVESLVIGGENAGPSMTAGNLISGNNRSGIRAVAPDPVLNETIMSVGIFGNRIGTTLAGTDPLWNEEGVRLDGRDVSFIEIGIDGDDAYGNLISGNKKEGVLITEEANRIRLFNNVIGAGIDKDKRLPNESHGVWIRQGANRNVLEKNIIRFNKEHGIFVSEQQSDRNKFSRNSIHMNGNIGIRIQDGANGGIKAPTITRVFHEGKLVDRVLVSVAEQGLNIEAFADPMRTDEPGFWGQGKNYFLSAASPAQGKLTLERSSIREEGVLTFTVTDPDGNTSEFSPFFTTSVVQTVDHPKSLLVAGKKTAVRIFLDSGKHGDNVKAQGELWASYEETVTADPPELLVRPYPSYLGNKELRQKGQNSLNFHLPKPPVGMHFFELTLRDQNGERRGFSQLDREYHFQKTNTRNIGIVMVVTPPKAGGPPSVVPDVASIQEAMNYFSQIYPVDTEAMMSSFRFLPPIVFPELPHTEAAQKRLSEELEKRRVQFSLPGFPPLDYAAGFVSDGTTLDAPGSPYVLYGYTYPGSLPKAVVLRDRATWKSPPHMGNTFAHEIGHTPPFNLSDTYVGGAIGEPNPRPLQVYRQSNVGIVLLEDTGVYSPQAALSTVPIFNQPGPVHSHSNSTDPVVNDFMGNSPPAWVEPRAYEIAFAALGGVIPGAKAQPAILKSEMQDGLIVIGKISKSNQVELEPIIPWKGPIERLEPETVSAVVAQLLDEAGDVLDEVSIEVDFLSERLGTHSGDENGHFGDYESLDTIPFSVVLRDLAGGAHVVKVNGQTELARLTRSGNAPTISLITSLGPGALTGDAVALEYTATDADGGQTAELIINVFYTADGGNTRLPVVASAVNSGTATVPLLGLPASDEGRFIIRASDGWNIAEDTSDPFIIGNAMPTAKITSPESMGSSDVALAVALNGLGFDWEDGALTGESLVWTLNGDTVPIGTGMSQIVSLPEGPHLIRLTATDSHGATAFDEVNFDIVRKPATALEIAELILKRSEEAIDPDRNDDARVDAADVQQAVDD